MGKYAKKKFYEYKKNGMSKKVSYAENLEWKKLKALLPNKIFKK